MPFLSKGNVASLKNTIDLSNSLRGGGKEEERVATHLEPAAYTTPAGKHNPEFIHFYGRKDQGGFQEPVGFLSIFRAD